MSRGDLQVIGVSGGARPYRVAASATRFYSGEPIKFAGTYSSGVATANTVVVLTDGKPVIGTDSFVGIAHKDAKVNSAGTVTAHTGSVVVPIPGITRIRGKAKTAANIDTDAELLGVLQDLVLFDLTSAAYTIDETAAADTSGLMVVDGDPVKATLDVTVDARALRADIS
jgi:hypothetical protein